MDTRKPVGPGRGVSRRLHLKTGMRQTGSAKGCSPGKSTSRSLSRLFISGFLTKLLNIIAIMLYTYLGHLVFLDVVALIRKVGEQ